MSVKITKLTRDNVRALRECLSPEDAAKVTLTATTAAFNMSAAEAVSLVRRVQGQQQDHTGHPYASLHAVVRKLGAAERPAPGTRVAGPGEHKALRDLLTFDQPS